METLQEPTEKIVIPIFKDKTLHIPWYIPWGVEAVREVSVNYDPEKTVILRAYIEGWARASAVTRLDLSLNGVYLGSFVWQAWEGGQTKQGGAIVTDLLRMGTNIVKISFYRVVYYPLDAGCTCSFNLVIEYYGIKPKVKVLTWIEKYKWWIIAATLASILFIVAYVKVAGRKR